MGMSISAVGNGYPSLDLPGNRNQQAAAAVEDMEQTQKQTEPQNIQTAVSQLEQISLAFNKRLGFRVDKELDQVIVKVIDRETDKVIREIPSEELQRLHLRIKETVGLLFDMTI